MIKFPLQFEDFICEPYSTLEHRTSLSRFDTLEIKDENGKSYTPIGLENSIRNEVVELDKSSLLKTFLVYELHDDFPKKEFACVFCLRCSSINYQNTETKDRYNQIVPAIELVFLAVDKNYRIKHPLSDGLGVAVFDAFIVPVVKEISCLVGCKYLFLFSINSKKLVNYYINNMDFMELDEEYESSVVNNLLTEYNEECKFLYQPIDCL